MGREEITWNIVCSLPRSWRSLTTLQLQGLTSHPAEASLAVAPSTCPEEAVLSSVHLFSQSRATSLCEGSTIFGITWAGPFLMSHDYFTVYGRWPAFCALSTPSKRCLRFPKMWSNNPFAWPYFPESARSAIRLESDSYPAQHHTQSQSREVLR